MEGVSVCLSFDLLNHSSNNFTLGGCIRSQGSAVSSVKLFGWAVLGKAASGNAGGQAMVCSKQARCEWAMHYYCKFKGFHQWVLGSITIVLPCWARETDLTDIQENLCRFSWLPHTGKWKIIWNPSAYFSNITPLGNVFSIHKKTIFSTKQCDGMVYSITINIYNWLEEPFLHSFLS